jgi:hypothetical protein
MPENLRDKGPPVNPHSDRRQEKKTPVVEQKPGWYRRVIGRKRLPVGKRDQGSDFLISASPHFSVSAFAFASQMWSQEFTAKLFCNVEFWIARLPKLIGSSENLSEWSRMARPGENLTVSSG